MIDWAAALNSFSANIISIIALVISAGALMVSVLAYHRARKMGSLNVQFEAITHIRNAKRDMTRGVITGKTVTSIHDALHISSLVFSSRVTSALSLAHAFAYRLQRKSFERMSNKEYGDKDFLINLLDNILKTMLEEATLSKVVRQAEDRAF